jgi:hypothetical protein
MQTEASTRKPISTITASDFNEDLTAKIRRELGLITRAQYCAATNRTVRAVKRDWTLRRGPKPIRIGNETFYRLADVRAYVEQLAEQCA